MWPKRVLYRGVWMRSQLEVRWAQFLETCEIAWEYEPVRFRRYTPDFALDDTRQLFLEVKGPRVKLNRLEACPFPLIVAWGSPDPDGEIALKDYGVGHIHRMLNFATALSHGRMAAAREYLPYKESE